MNRCELLEMRCVGLLTRIDVRTRGKKSDVICRRQPSFLQKTAVGFFWGGDDNYVVFKDYIYIFVNM